MSAHSWLSAIVRTLALPPLSLFILAAAGWALSYRWPRAGRTLLLGALVALYLLCTQFVAGLLVAPLEAKTAPLTASAASNAQAIVVLAAGSLRQAPEYGGADIPDYIALGRLRYAAKLQHTSNLPILVSGGDMPFDNAAGSLAASMALALREDFRTPVAWIEDRSENTAENALFSARILKQNGIHRILLVTDAMHMPRAVMAFARNGLDVVAAPTLFFGKQAQGIASFLPSAEGLRRSTYALYEWLGFAWYARPGLVPGNFPNT